RRNDPDHGRLRARREAHCLLRSRRLEEVHRQIREADAHLTAIQCTARWREADTVWRTTARASPTVIVVSRFWVVDGFRWAMNVTTPLPVPVSEVSVIQF